MLNRRRFLKAIAAAATTPVLAQACQSNKVRPNSLINTLQADPNQIIDLPPGYAYSVISRRGETMADGLPVPGAHDGMAAFNGDDGRVILVRNHELSTRSKSAGPYADSCEHLPDAVKSRFYDQGSDLSPGLGGTTTTIYNPISRESERQFLSLGGTDINCAGGKTPWGSWLSCEESFAHPGDGTSNQGTPITLDKRHGYVFEVPAAATELIDAHPLKDMGRFEHEAAAVHAASGVVYLTEDQWHSLFYRFIPNVPGQLHKGGRLQALAIVGEPSKPTHNWDREDVTVNAPIATYWIDLENVDSDSNDLRLRGAAAGAATFARGEGITVAGDQFAFCCTIGGPARLGQVFTYSPSPFEGTDREQEKPGQLTLIAEGSEDTLFNNCDNLTMAPWGDLILCEDTAANENHCALVGIRPDGSQYLLANNAYSDSEVAGVCFSPDGQTMFLNIQYPGMTLAITGNWPT
jgi:secreted PhoX family phosphatase